MTSKLAEAHRHPIFQYAVSNDPCELELQRKPCITFRDYLAYGDREYLALQKVFVLGPTIDALFVSTTNPYNVFKVDEVWAKLLQKNVVDPAIKGHVYSKVKQEIDRVIRKLATEMGVAFSLTSFKGEFVIEMLGELRPEAFDSRKSLLYRFVYVLKQASIRLFIRFDHPDFIKELNGFVASLRSLPKEETMTEMTQMPSLLRRIERRRSESARGTPPPLENPIPVPQLQEEHPVNEVYPHKVYDMTKDNQTFIRMIEEWLANEKHPLKVTDHQFRSLLESVLDGGKKVEAADSDLSEEELLFTENGIISVESLIGQLQVVSVRVRCAAATVLGARKLASTDTKTVIEALLLHLTNNHFPIRRSCVLALGALTQEWEEEAEAVMPSLISTLRDLVPEVQKAAALSLSRPQFINRAGVSEALKAADLGDKPPTIYRHYPWPIEIEKKRDEKPAPIATKGAPPPKVKVRAVEKNSSVPHLPPKFEGEYRFAIPVPVAGVEHDVGGAIPVQAAKIEPAVGAGAHTPAPPPNLDVRHSAPLRAAHPSEEVVSRSSAPASTTRSNVEEATVSHASSTRENSSSGGYGESSRGTHSQKDQDPDLFYY